MNAYYRRFTVITTCHGRWHHLELTWPTWVAQDYPRTDFVIATSGPDEAPMQLAADEQFYGTLLRIRNTSYFRPSRYRNLGAMVSRGEYLGFVDADVSLAPQWVSYCVSKLKQRYDLIINEASLRGNDAGGISGTMAISRWLFEKIRGYNENLDSTWGYEDTDLIIRAQRAGGRVSGYPVGLLRVIRHGDKVRQKNFLQSELRARLPKLYLRHMRMCDEDARLHPYEVNFVSRIGPFPVEQLSQVNK